MWKPVAAQINSAMKATIEQLESLGLTFINGTITKVHFNDGLFNLTISLDENDYAETIFLKVSAAEFAKYHDYYLLTAINDALKSVKITDIVIRAQILKEANEIIRKEFLDKTAIITVQELEPGAPIYLLDGSVYADAATLNWIKYSLYEWK